MKPHLILLVVLAFVAGVFAGEKARYYRVDPVDSNNLLVACTDGGQPLTNIRLDQVLKVYCHTPAQKH